MEEKDMLIKERNELNALIKKGVYFEVEDFEVSTHKVFFGLFKKRTATKVVRKFKIDEPTLSTLDRLTAEYIEFAIDDNAMKSDDGMVKARGLAHQHSLRCAKVVAIAVLGTDYLIPKVVRNGVVKYVEDVETLNRMTAMFARAIKPSELYQLYVLINAMSNLGDFLNSIRLMSTDRTTMPIRIEESNEA